MTREDRCRSCRSRDLHAVLSLGETPLANRLLTKEQLSEPEPRYPLDVVFCSHCTLVQITETVPPEQLFSEYLYFSSFSDTVVENARDNVESVLRRKPLGRDDLVVEIASNDGYLLQHYRQRDIPVLGIEPAANIAAVARDRGIPTRSEFFGISLAERLRAEGTSASVIHASNVLAHVADLNGVVAGMAALLRDDGIVVIEVPYLLDMIERCEFDTIYHEHLCYFSVTALVTLFRRHGLDIVDVAMLPIHGGTIRVTAGRGPVLPAVTRALENEKAWGVDRIETYRAFGARIEAMRRDLLSLLGTLQRERKRIAAYGASAKGATLLNYFGIGAETLQFVVDRSTVKQGRFTPGTHLPIVGPERLEQDAPDYLLLLTWNHADEILRQQESYRSRGGRFIIPVPAPTIV